MGGFVNGGFSFEIFEKSDFLKNQVFEVFGNFWARIRIPCDFLCTLRYFSAQKVPWGRVLGQNKIWEFLGLVPPHLQNPSFACL